ncbi:MAG: DsrE/DsrF/TusD sulfur relay family protein [Promethearchaeota archaeon]|jgi:sulfur relay (sulfurtransferase) complex TusBCD TusD component (DsrE family)
MVSFTFVVCAEPYKYEAIDTVINLGEAILNKGHQIVGIFFYGSGVYNIKTRKIKDTTIRNLSERLENFCKINKTEFAACSTWTSFSGIKSEEFVEGAHQEGLGGLSLMIAESDKVIFFGPGG